MENATLAVGPAFVGGGTLRIRLTALLAAVALVLAMFVLVQNVDPSPAGASVAAAVTAVGESAQLNFNQLFCSILLAVRNAFANSPFFSFIVAALNPIIVAFGCAPS